VPELLHNAYIPFFVFVCVSVYVSEREIIHMGEQTHVCESIHMHVCVCVCKHMCMEVCITLRSVNVLITTKKFQPCNGCNVYVYNVKFVCFFWGGGGCIICTL